MNPGEASAAERAEVETPRPQVLIVEDEPAIAVLFETLLHIEGYEPIIATSTERALRLVDESQPDLVILDVMMPDRSGLDVCRHVRQRESLREIPVIIVSARTQESDIEVGYRAGADVYLEKPISNDELINVVRGYSSRSRHPGNASDRGLPVELEMGRVVLEDES